MRKETSAIFNTELNEFARKYIVISPESTNYSLASGVAEFPELLASLCEQFLIFDRISFKVYGENVPLCFLINLLGVKQLEALIEEEVIEFVLWTPLIGYTKDNMDNLIPLVSGNFSSKAHSDPEKSITLGFNFLSQNLDRRVRRMLQKKVEKLYRVPDEEFAHNSVKLVTDAYNSNKLQDIGMPSTNPIDKLSIPEKSKLCDYASDVLETTLLSKYKYSSFGKYSYYSIAEKSFHSIQKALNVEQNLNQILTLEGIPDIKSLFLSDKLLPKDILKLRQKSSTKHFRSWLNSVSKNVDAESISKEYIDSLVNSKGFFESKKGKLLKTLGWSVIGAGVGSMLGGPAGTLIGSTSVPMLEKFIDLGLDLVDAYLLDGLIKGWNPRLFIDSLKKEIQV